MSKECARDGKIPDLYIVQLLGKAAPLALVHGCTAKHPVPRTSRSASAVAGLIDVQNVHKKGG